MLWSICLDRMKYCNRDLFSRVTSRSPSQKKKKVIYKTRSEIVGLGNQISLTQTNKAFEIVTESDKNPSIRIS